MDTEPPTAHVILTRFNVRVGYSDGRQLDPGWLDHRFTLFDDYCLPSMRHQTVDGFVWFVLFDESTPTRYRRRIETLAMWPAFRPLFAESFEAIDLDAEVRSVVGSDTETVITSRLDNDDAYSIDYLARIRRAAGRIRGPEVLNVSKGLVFDVPGRRLYERSHLANPFLSVIERLDSGQPLHTALGVEHKRWAAVAPVRQIDGPPGWMVTIHEHNVSNARGAERRVSPKVIRDRFVLPTGQLGRDIPAVRHAENMLESVARLTRRAGRPRR